MYNLKLSKNLILEILLVFSGILNGLTKVRSKFNDKFFFLADLSYY